MNARFGLKWITGYDRSTGQLKYFANTPSHSWMARNQSLKILLRYEIGYRVQSDHLLTMTGHSRIQQGGRRRLRVALLDVLSLVSP